MIHRSRDPLSAACAPPVNETPKQRVAREAKEAEARRVSERIDEQLRLENQRKNPSVKVLLLGQEGSGEFSSSSICFHPYLYICVCGSHRQVCFDQRSVFCTRRPRVS
jgi:hypothetical protein